MSKHTPGQWNAHLLGSSWRIYTGDNIKADRYSISGYDKEICTIDEDSEGVSKAQQKANAKLMAAAPELLSALESLMLAAENLDPQSGAPIGYDELLKAIGAADAVRQKARGAA